MFIQNPLTDYLNLLPVENAARVERDLARAREISRKYTVAWYVKPQSSDAGIVEIRAIKNRVVRGDVVFNLPLEWDSAVIG